MDKLIFYAINPDYLDYLRNVDSKVPECVESGHTKPFCGIVLEINNQKFYAPISSFNQNQQTNFIIKDGERPISSIRFCFMIPVPDEVLTRIDFSKEEPNYRALLEKEYRYCKQNIDTIRKKAQRVYNLCQKQNPLSNSCCNFKDLEVACKAYKKP